MNAQELIDETIEQSYEWLEMSTDPTYLMVGILANKIIKLQDHIEYLEERLRHVSINKR
jgi:hypothetical protein